MNLGRAFIVQSTATALLALLQLLSIILLSRLIGPAEFGYAATASGAALIGLALADVGFGASLIRKRHLTPRFKNVVLTIAAAVFFITNVAVFVVVSVVWRDDRITSLALIFGVGSFFMGMGGVVKSLLQRDLRYFSLLKVNGGAYFLGMIVVACLLASNGYGALSVAWGQLVYGVCTFTFAVLITRQSWRPAYVHRMLKPLMLFGGSVVANRVLDLLLTEMDKLFMARLSGFHKEGVYERVSRPGILAGGHASFIVDSVLYPRFCRELQGTSGLIHPSTLRLTSTFISIIMIGASALSLPMIRLILGELYLAYAPVLAILLMAAYLRIQSRPFEVLFRARGIPHVSAWIKVGPAAGLVIGLISVADYSLEFWAWIFVGAQASVLLIQAFVGPMFGVSRSTSLVIVGVHCPVVVATMALLSAWAEGLQNVLYILGGAAAAMAVTALLAFSSRRLSGANWGDIFSYGRKALIR